jgi:hypothetical protein
MLTRESSWRTKKRPALRPDASKFLRRDVAAYRFMPEPPVVPEAPVPEPVVCDEPVGSK